MAWRVAKALSVLRDQFNTKYPNRKKGADGTIGDAAHKSRSSDHNPWIQDSGTGVVSALDITHDPANGVDTWAIAEYFRQKRDSRIKYVISNRRIFSSTTSPWVWREYTGSNPHSSHMHVSVKASKSHYDDSSPWDLNFTATTASPPIASEGPNPDSPTVRPVLRRGSKGEAVRTVQRLLTIKIDGIFGPNTDSAVRAFQRGVALVPTDGIVGPETWAELDQLEQIPHDTGKQRNIIATVFGGKANPEKSAYANRYITDEEFGVALPKRFKGGRPQIDVANTATGRRVVCEIVDVGPWLTDDDYWRKRERPIAEQYWQQNKKLDSGPNKGRVPNGAGIDLTPAAAREIGLAGKGRVDWAFTEEEDEGDNGNG